MVDQKGPTLVSAIDVGSSSIRMEISEIQTDGKIRSLESLSRGVALGKDTFTSGHLSEETLQKACQTLTDFSQVMKGYGINKYRAVATSAVREASNADTFLDRVFLRSGLEVEIIDGSEENRLTFLAIHDALSGMVDIKTRNVLIVEVGGGSTDISFLHEGQPFQSGTFALGAVRVRQSLIAVKGDLKKRIRILERQIKNTVDTIGNSIPFDQAHETVALGGDIRFAAKYLSGESSSNGHNSWTIDKKDFAKFCTEVIKYDTDGLVSRYGITYPEAETLVPALLAYRNIIERTKTEKIHVLSASIRAGILLDMTRRITGKELESFDGQVVASAKALARKYNVNENHFEQVRRLSLSLFDQMQSEHGLERRDRLLLEVAAVLHDVGTFISDRSHHKHTQYIIGASEIFGLSRNELNLIANIARYHRKSPPTRAHVSYMALDRESRMTISKLSALLRVADALDQDYSNKVRNVKLIREDEQNRYALEVEAESDLAMEQLSLNLKSDLFKEIYGRPIVMRQVERLETV
ncbi:MAG: exopolyphosphatase [Acidobacteria bacterium]|nr:MAG: exopolyphosphatase [Acidobacteriota bacterium]